MSKFNFKLEYINHNRIVPNPYQTRKEFKDSELKQLKESINKFGLINPIVVRKVKDNKFQILHGERRFRALRHEGKIPVLISNFTDEQMMIGNIIENVVRKDLLPYEKAKGLNLIFNKILGNNYFDIYSKYIFSKTKARWKAEEKIRDDYYLEFSKIDKVNKQLGLHPNTIFYYLLIAELPIQAAGINNTNKLKLLIRVRKHENLSEFINLAKTLDVSHLEQRINLAVNKKVYEEKLKTWHENRHYLLVIKRINSLIEDYDFLIKNKDSIRKERLEMILEKTFIMIEKIKALKIALQQEVILNA